MSFRENLRFIMESKGIQTKELSLKTGISENTIKSYVKSDSAEPKISKALAIAKALNVSVDFLVTGIDPFIKKQKTSIELTITENIQKLSDRDLMLINSIVLTMIKTNKT